MFAKVSLGRHSFLNITHKTQEPSKAQNRKPGSLLGSVGRYQTVLQLYGSYHGAQIKSKVATASGTSPSKSHLQESLALLSQDTTN